MVSCEAPKKEPAQETDQTADEQTEAEVEESGFSLFGEDFDHEGSMSLDGALDSISNLDSLEVKVAATVNDVCQVKGCWMTMSGSDGKEVRVKFKDYSFFVPKDCSGKTAYVTGVMKREVVSVEMQKHLLEDNNASQEEIDAITEPEESLTFMASGVKLQ